MKDLTLNYTAIGSLPLEGKDAPLRAIDTVFENFKDIPFWPQLPHYSHREDMVMQFAYGMTGLEFDGNKYFFNTDSKAFEEKLEEFYFDWEVISSADSLIENEEILDKYSLSESSSSTFGLFINHLNKSGAKFAKGSITGAFTTSTSLCDISGKCAYYDEILRDIITKTLALKALWQIKEIKKVNSEITPIIFMDEPSVSQLGSSAFLTVNDREVLEMFDLIAGIIKKFAALAGMHCCGKANWEIPISASVDIINFDAYSYPQSVALHHKKIKSFLNNGGFMAFGTVPTLSDKLILSLSEEDLLKSFENSLKCFIDKSLDKEILLRQTFITPSCGCGSLTLEGANKVIYHTRKLSENLKEKYRGIL